MVFNDKEGMRIAFEEAKKGMYSIYLFYLTSMLHVLTT